MSRIALCFYWSIRLYRPFPIRNNVRLTWDKLCVVDLTCSFCFLTWRIYIYHQPRWSATSAGQDICTTKYVFCARDTLVSSTPHCPVPILPEPRARIMVLRNSCREGIYLFFDILLPALQGLIWTTEIPWKFVGYRPSDIVIARNHKKVWKSVVG